MLLKVTLMRYFVGGKVMLMTAMKEVTNQTVAINNAAKARQGGETPSWQRLVDHQAQ